ncbi:MAG TPA: DUF3108 domain-containing protein [Bryobacteraceae bacterium]|nr:DUF3108 domain-containing protein [Bryobacteraceae bacterium]HOQ44344.1 DUF3108 domain-containing protein [Bryobacteraceae bacterium]HPQ13782.1 DUF3108 domain-containing protein [Bryobacteraceae bacterium]HPU70663.1 DUF3108 domain-containing protein [Bryobacteraceae bacterium]
MKYSAFLVVFIFAGGLGLCAEEPSATPKTPFSEESLAYTVNWPSGLSLGQAQLISKRSGDKWHFALSLDAAIPGFVVSDSYQSTAAGDFCSEEFVKTFTHGRRKAGEKETFHSENGTATRQTLGGGKSEISAPGCARDALTFLFFLRRELAQGRLPGSQTIYFGAPYQLKLEYGGVQQIRVNDRPAEAEQLRASLKGPASENSFELFFARDDARTPLMIRVPFKVGTFSLELVR